MNTIISKIDNVNKNLDVMDYAMTNNMSRFKHKTIKKIYSDASEYSPSGSREMKFQIAIKEWLDLKTVVLACKIKNNSATGTLNKIGNLTSLFSKMTIKINNQVVEEINNYGRFCNLMSLYNDEEEKKDINILNGGGNLDVSSTGTVSDTSNIFIAANGSRNVYIKLPSGLLETAKLLPGMYLNQIEITLNLDSADACFLRPNDEATALTVSNDFKITDARIELTSYELDQILQGQFDEIIKSGSALPISYIQYSQYNQAMPNSVSSHLLSINSYNVHGVNVSFFRSPGANAHGVRNNNLFYATGDNDIKISLNIGGVTVNEVSSVSEAYYTSSKRVNEKKLNVSASDYKTRKFLTNFDLKKSPEGETSSFEIHDYSGFQLLNTGSVLVNTYTADTATPPTEIYIVVSMVSLLEMRNIGLTAWK